MANTDFTVNTVSTKEAHTKLRSLRAGRGGRRSAYIPVLEQLKNARKGQVVTVEGLEKNQVQSLRNFVYRHLDREEWVVKSAREKGAETYTCAIGRVDDF